MASRGRKQEHHDDCSQSSELRESRPKKSTGTFTIMFIFSLVASLPIMLTMGLHSNRAVMQLNLLLTTAATWRIFVEHNYMTNFQTFLTKLLSAMFSI